MIQTNLFDAEFFPTPKHIIRKMLEGYGDLHNKTILEPSAGKGDILDYVIELTDRWQRPKIYAIEKDTNLQHILRDKDYKVISQDFLSYSGDYYFDLIIMNPPFSSGDEHLLKAWEVMKEGNIVCLLNRETYFNPYSEKRKLLKDIIDKNGSVEEIGEAFLHDAERNTPVKVIIVRLEKKAEKGTFDFDFQKVNSEENFKINEGMFEDKIAIRDVIGNMEIQYNKLKQTYIEYIKSIEGMKFYSKGLLSSYGKIKEIEDAGNDSCQSRYNSFADHMKKEIWRRVITEMKMERYMTKSVQENFSKFIDQQGAMDFTRENVFSMINTLFANKENIVNQAILDVFDLFTKYHKENRCHIEGWKTNDIWKVNRKVILPYWIDYGAYATADDLKNYGDKFKINYHKWSENADIDKVMCYLSGSNYETCRTLHNSLSVRFDSLGNVRTGQSFDNEGESQFFTWKFFKKGTLHITFKDKSLWERFNLSACEGKNWLPPNYKKAI
jgi:hypothetical protein